MAKETRLIGPPPSEGALQIPDQAASLFIAALQEHHASLLVDQGAIYAARSREEQHAVVARRIKLVSEGF